MHARCLALTSKSTCTYLLTQRASRRFEWLALQVVDLRIVLRLGFSCSCVGVWQNDRVEIIPNDQGNRTTPSYVAFTDTERLIGDAAKNQVHLHD